LQGHVRKQKSFGVNSKNVEKMRALKLKALCKDAYWYPKGFAYRIGLASGLGVQVKLKT